MKSALIVDDHPVVRAAVKIVLEQKSFRRILRRRTVAR